MPISTYVNDTGRPWKFILKYSDGTAPNLTGLGNSNFSIRITNGTTTFSGGGSFTVLDTVNAIVAYQPVTADVATAGSSWTYQVTMNPPAGPTTFPVDTLNIQVKI